MLATDLFIQPASGFIAITPGRADDTVAERSSPAPVDAREAGTAPAAATVGWAGGVDQRPTWQSPAGASVRTVEAAIVGSICAFFAFGLASTLGLF